LYPKIPTHVLENELFYNRNNDYAKLFGVERMNYLHMEDFVCNIHARAELNRYQFHHRIDDDSLFERVIDYNLFEKLLENDSPMGTSHLWSNINQNLIDVRENLFDFYINFLKQNNITPLSTRLKEAVRNKSEKDFHLLPWSSGNCNLYNQNYFLNDSRWFKWIDLVNEYAGTYKHRWGDQEIIGLYTYTFFENPIVDFNLVEKGIYQARNNKAKTVLIENNTKRVNIIRKLINRIIVRS